MILKTIDGQDVTLADVLKLGREVAFKWPKKTKQEAVDLIQAAIANLPVDSAIRIEQERFLAEEQGLPQMQDRIGHLIGDYLIVPDDQK